MRDRSLLLLVLVLLTAPARAEHRVYLPVEARSGAPSPVRDATLRFGLPLSSSSRVLDVSELVLTGAARYRLVAGTRRPDGTIEWVFVGATVDLPGGGLGLQLVLTTGAGAKEATGEGARDLPDGSPGVVVGPLPEATSLATDPLLRLAALLEAGKVELPDPSGVLSLVRTLRSGRLPDGKAQAALRSAGELVSLSVAARVTGAPGDLDAAFAALARETPPAAVPSGEPARAAALRAALLLLADRVRSDAEADLVDDAAEREAAFDGRAATLVELPPGLSWRRLAVTRTERGVAFLVPKGLRRLRIKHAPEPIAEPADPLQPTSSRQIPFWAATNVAGERTLVPAGSLARLDLPIPPGDHVAARYLEDAALLAPVVRFRPASRGLSPARWALVALAIGLASVVMWGLIMRRRK